jgi:hypothetical protein
MVEKSNTNHLHRALAPANLYGGADLDSQYECAPFGPGIIEDAGQSHQAQKDIGPVKQNYDDTMVVLSRLRSNQSVETGPTIKLEQINRLMENGRELIDRLLPESASKVISAIDRPYCSHLADAILGQLQHKEILNEYDAAKTEFVDPAQSQRVDTPDGEGEIEGTYFVCRNQQAKLDGIDQVKAFDESAPNPCNSPDDFSYDSMKRFTAEQRRASDGLSSRKAALLGYNARKKDLVRFRWRLAIWYATEESQRIKSQRRSTELNLLAIQRAGQHYVMHRRSSSGAVGIRRNSHRSQSSAAEEESGPDYRDSGASTLASRRQSFISWDRLKSSESTWISQKSALFPDHETRLSWQQIHKFVILTCSMYTLYMIDLYVITTEDMPIKYDIFVYSLNALCFLVFVLDLLHGLFTDPKFWRTIYMWLELLAILSMIPDVFVLIFLVIDADHQLPTRFTNLLRLVRLGKFIGQAARTGASKASRINFAFQQIHPFYLKICKLFRHPKNKIDCHNTLDGAEAHMNWKLDSGNDILRSHGSYLGKSSIGHDLDQTVSKYHTIMVSVLLVLGECTASMLSYDKQAQAEMNLSLLAVAASNCKEAVCNLKTFAVFLENSGATGQHVLFFRILENLTYGDETAANKYRVYPYPEVIIASLPSNSTGTLVSMIHILNRDNVILQCLSSVITTSVVLVFLTLLTTSLAGTIRNTVIVPLQRMVATVLALEAEPLRPLRRNLTTSSYDTQNIHEVTLIENALLKIASLLQLGFGEAGDILNSSMKEIQCKTCNFVVKKHTTGPQIRNKRMMNYCRCQYHSRDNETRTFWGVENRCWW